MFLYFFIISIFWRASWLYGNQMQKEYYFWPFLMFFINALCANQDSSPWLPKKKKSIWFPFSHLIEWLLAFYTIWFWNPFEFQTLFVGFEPEDTDLLSHLAARSQILCQSSVFLTRTLGFGKDNFCSNWYDTHVVSYKSLDLVVRESKSILNREPAPWHSWRKTSS
jgi:hypothetical protein